MMRRLDAHVSAKRFIYNVASCSAFWRNAGCSPRAAAALGNAKISRLDQIASFGRDYFHGLPNCGPRTVAEIGALIGGWPADHKPALDAVASALAIAIADPEEAKVAAMDALIALRRAGYVIATINHGDIAPEDPCQAKFDYAAE